MMSLFTDLLSAHCSARIENLNDRKIGPGRFLFHIHLDKLFVYKCMYVDEFLTCFEKIFDSFS